MSISVKTVVGINKNACLLWNFRIFTLYTGSSLMIKIMFKKKETKLFIVQEHKKMLTFATA